MENNSTATKKDLEKRGGAVLIKMGKNKNKVNNVVRSK